MASKLVQLQSKASQASKFVANHGTSYYKQLLEQKKQYIQEPATIEKCNELSKQLLYTRLASIPGRYETFWKEVDYAKSLLKNRANLKVEDAGIAALFGLECFAWYCAGEIVGRGMDSLSLVTTLETETTTTTMSPYDSSLNYILPRIHL